MNDKQIMLIEDNPDDRDLTIRAFRKNNVLNPVTVAGNGAEALTMLFGDETATRATRRSSCST
jgi:two-component system response regulator